MSAGTKIQWTEATWNPVTGCTRVSAGCDHCYAAAMTHRLGSMGQAKYAGLTVFNGKGEHHFNGVVRTHDDVLSVPLRRRKPTTYFVNSMSDLFHKDVPFGFIDKVFAVMALCPQHRFQILTKRPERMAEYTARGYFPIVESMQANIQEQVRVDAVEAGAGGFWPLQNVWVGTSCEDQAAADERIPHLRRCPAAIHFLSLEPLLGPIRKKLDGIEWVIVGGESGPGARSCYTDWFESIRDQCRVANVPLFVKQLGSNHHCVDEEFGDLRIPSKDGKGGDPSEWPEDLRIREMPDATR